MNEQLLAPGALEGLSGLKEGVLAQLPSLEGEVWQILRAEVARLLLLEGGGLNLLLEGRGEERHHELEEAQPHELEGEARGRMQQDLGEGQPHDLVVEVVPRFDPGEGGLRLPPGEEQHHGLEEEGLLHPLKEGEEQQQP